MTMMSMWTIGDASRVMLMWTVMMTGMMLPSATPAIAAFVRRERERSTASRIGAALGFTAGYLVVWAAFSASVTILQWQLDSRGMLTSSMALRDARIAAIVLIAVGAYQLTPSKHVCLVGCQARALSEGDLGGQRTGRWSALLHGAKYGVACLGCCATLMGLLFVGGVMNPLWISLIAALVFLEKVLPSGIRVARIAGVCLAVWGTVRVFL